MCIRSSSRDWCGSASRFSTYNWILSSFCNILSLSRSRFPHILVEQFRPQNVLLSLYTWHVICCTHMKISNTEHLTCTKPLLKREDKDSLLFTGDWLQRVNGISVDFSNVNATLLQILQQESSDNFENPLKVSRPIIPIHKRHGKYLGKYHGSSLYD